MFKTKEFFPNLNPIITQKIALWAGNCLGGEIAIPQPGMAET